MPAGPVIVPIGLLMSAHTGRMLLTARDPLLSLSTNLLKPALRESGFIGDPVPGLDEGFLVGQQFLSLITFAGCSVQIRLEPPSDGGGFCHVRFEGPSERPILVYGRNTRPPRCPGCRAPHRDWRSMLLAPRPDVSTKLACPDCTAERPPWDWDWKGNAGFGRTFILVEEIFPGEAIPAPGLIAILERASGVPWRHFYVQD